MTRVSPGSYSYSPARSLSCMSREERKHWSSFQLCFAFIYFRSITLREENGRGWWKSWVSRPAYSSPAPMLFTVLMVFFHTPERILSLLFCDRVRVSQWEGTCMEMNGSLRGNNVADRFSHTNTCALSKWKDNTCTICAQRCYGYNLHQPISAYSTSTSKSASFPHQSLKQLWHRSIILYGAILVV